MLRYLLVTVLLSVLCLGFAHASDEAYRDLWIELIDSLERYDPVPSPTAGKGFDAAREAFFRLSPEELEVLKSTSATPEVLAGLNQMLAAPPRAGVQEIEQPKPPGLGPECDGTEPSSALALLGIKLVLEEILAGAKWVCHQTELGVNSALACVGPELAANAATAAFELAEFCLSEGKTATGEAILGTTRNIADFLDGDLTDSVALRSTQDSVDDVQDSVDLANSGIGQANDSLADVQGRLPTLQSSADQALLDLDALETQLNGAVSQLQEMQFRLQSTQVMLEDTDERTAAVELLAEEVRANTQSLIVSLSGLLTEISQQYAQLETAQRHASRERIASTLASTDGGVLRYRFPRAMGGQLEEVREVVIHAASLMDQSGLDISASLSLIATGNAAFNNSEYLAAYGAYAQAYRLLLQVAP